MIRTRTIRALRTDCIPAILQRLPAEDLDVGLKRERWSADAYQEIARAESRTASMTCSSIGLARRQGIRSPRRSIGLRTSLTAFASGMFMGRLRDDRG
jgi:hypothetical protein